MEGQIASTMATPEQVHTHGVAVQLPPFMKASPTAWFTLCDANFFIRKVTDSETKFWYVVSKLDEETLKRIHAFLAKPRDKDPYKAIREVLCESFEPSVEQKLDTMLAASSMGSEKPSDFMAELDRLAAGLDIEDVKRRIFVRSLPERISTAISGFSGTTAELVRAADKSWAQAGETAAVSSIAKVPKAGRGRGNKNGNQLRPADPGSPRSATPLLCPFHKKYGDSARRCLPTCPRWTAKYKPHQVFLVEEEEEEVAPGNE